MSFLRLYRYREKLILPTVVQAAEGFYMDTEPVIICDTTSDADLRRHIAGALGRTNPVVPTPDKADEPGSAVLNALGIHKWRTFESESVMLSIYLTAGGIEYYSTGHPVGGEWKGGRGKHITLPADTSEERLVDLIVQELKEPPPLENRTSGSGIMLLPPPTEE